MTDNTNSKNQLGRTPLVPKYINNVRSVTPIRLDKNETNVNNIKNPEVKVNFTKAKSELEIIKSEVEKDFSSLVYVNKGFQRFSFDNYHSEDDADANYGTSHAECVYDRFENPEIEEKEFAMELKIEEPECEAASDDMMNSVHEFFNSNVKFFNFTEKDIEIDNTIKKWLDEGLFYSEIV
jgi:hypothetical protein